MSSPDPFGRIRDFYNREYHVDARLSAKGVAWHMRHVAGRLEPLHGRVALDIACGAGGWLSHLQSRGCTVAGIDISERAIQRCRELIPQAELAVGPAEHLPFKTDQFDLVTCMGSLEHFIDKPGALGEMRRVCKSNGRILLLVPNAGFLTRRLGLFRGTEQTQVREDVLPLSAWRALFEEAGLSILARWRDLHPLDPAWIRRGSLPNQALRAAQAVSLAVWPLGWQYQVYFLCDPRK